MAVSFELPEAIERQLRESVGDLDAAAKEAALVELYRQTKITRHELSYALGLDRLATESLLKQHGVTEDLLTVAEFNEQIVGLRKILGE